MKDIIEFAVVCGYLISDPPPVLNPGDVLRLVLEPENTYDPYAVAVYKGEQKVGYVPNKGKLCATCWEPRHTTGSMCEFCANDVWVKGGLARRIVELEILEGRTACMVYEVRPGYRQDLYIAQLVIE